MTTSSPNDDRRAGAFCASALAFVVTILALVATSCRMDVVGPAQSLGLDLGGSIVGPVSPTTSAPPDAPLDTIQAMVPAITQLHADIRRDTLFVRGQIRQRSRFYTPFYNPNKIGGWSLQVFVDSDPLNSIYWRGYDYVVRGVEWSPRPSTFVVRQITLDPTTPGGWGPQSGLAAFAQGRHDFEVAIPLESVGFVEHDVNYCVETYATTECSACDGGLTQEWSDDYFATLSEVRAHETPSGAPPGGLAARLMPRRGHRSSADPALVWQRASGR